jgi:hypothetical protein
MLQTSKEELYSARLARYVTAMHLGLPDCVPLRPFAAEVTARHAGFTCQEVTHDYRKAFEVIIRPSDSLTSPHPILLQFTPLQFGRFQARQT